MNNRKVQVVIKEKPLLFFNGAKYLGITVDVGLKWKEHIKKKHEFVIRNFG